MLNHIKNIFKRKKSRVDCRFCLTSGALLRTSHKAFEGCLYYTHKSGLGQEYIITNLKDIHLIFDHQSPISNSLILYAVERHAFNKIASGIFERAVRNKDDFYIKFHKSNAKRKVIFMEGNSYRLNETEQSSTFIFSDIENRCK